MEAWRVPVVAVEAGCAFCCGGWVRIFAVEALKQACEK